MFWRTKPAAAPDLSDLSPEQRERHERVARVIASFRPFIQGDGGDIEFLGIDEQQTVRVRLTGACVGCPASFMTLQMGLERHIREQVPEIRAVENVA